CSLLAPSDAILFQEGVSVKLRLPQSSGMQLQNFLQLIPISTEQVVLWRGIFAIFPSVKLASWQ
ncbi:hypothetical protein, partial [Shigella flexneri]